MGRGNDRLSDRRRRFAQEYLIDGNATRSAKAAGYSERTAYSQGQRLLKDVEVQTFLRSKRKKVEEELELTAKRLDEETARLAYRDPVELVDPETGILRNLQDIPEDVRRCITSVTVDQSGKFTYRLERKTDALTLAYRRRGLLKDQVDVTVRSHADLMREAARRAGGCVPSEEEKEEGGGQ